MTKQRRLAAVILAAIFLLVMATSLFVVACEVDHDCCGEDCLICAILAVCQNTLRALSDALPLVAVIAAAVFCAASLIAVCKAALHVETPISLKVKLLN